MVEAFLREGRVISEERIREFLKKAYIDNNGNIDFEKFKNIMRQLN